MQLRFPHYLDRGSRYNRSGGGASKSAPSRGGGISGSGCEGQCDVSVRSVGKILE